MSDQMRSTLAFTAPFVVFIAFLALRTVLPFEPSTEYFLRIAATTAALVIFSRRAVGGGAWHAGAAALVGVAVFAVWVAPDYLFPGYRSHWLFENALTGTVASSLPENTRIHLPFLLIRTFGSAIVVPVIEELFWRGWLMRWLVDPDFERVPVGAYTPWAFWATAALFALEHGPYWDVGLAAGAIYNLWVVRTGSLRSAMLAHGVTNALLAAWVIARGEWHYWL